MKQKNGGIKRLLEFTGEKRSLLNISRILSGVSAIFILGPFLCVYFAARELVNVFTGSALDTQSLVRWGMIGNDESRGGRIHPWNFRLEGVWANGAVHNKI